MQSVCPFEAYYTISATAFNQKVFAGQFALAVYVYRIWRVAFEVRLLAFAVKDKISTEMYHRYSSGWLYVYDHCTAIWKVLTEAAPGELYNIGGCNEKTNLEVIGLILKQLGKPESLIRHVKDRPGHDRRYAIDADKIITELSWQPSVSFEQGIEKTIDWYISNEKWLFNVVSGEYQKYYDAMYSNR